MDTPAFANIPADAEYLDMIHPDNLNADDIEFDLFDQYLSIEFLVHHNDEMMTPKVIKRAKGNSGNLMGKRDMNP